MYRRLMMLTVTAPLLAQSGCTEQDAIGLVTVVLQTLLTTMIPLLVNTLLGGGTTGLGI